MSSYKEHVAYKERQIIGMRLMRIYGLVPRRQKEEKWSLLFSIFPSKLH